MDFIISGRTDIGDVKDVNQDSFNVMTLKTKLGRMVFAVVCDGMGGYTGGEIASASVVNAFRNWVITRLKDMCDDGSLNESQIKKEWNDIANYFSQKLKEYGVENGMKPGTTLAAILITQTKFYVINIGDSRVYEIANKLRRLTEDQTLVAAEVREGKLTEEEAELDERRNILLWGIGVTERLYPEFRVENVKSNAVYMVCSDGFRHEISNEEIYQNLHPDVLLNENIMNRQIDYLINTVKRRNEEDNITCVVIRTF